MHSIVPYGYQLLYLSLVIKELKKILNINLIINLKLIFTIYLILKVYDFYIPNLFKIFSQLSSAVFILSIDYLEMYLCLCAWEPTGALVIEYTIISQRI